MGKVLGIIGGVSWVSTQDYYQRINVAVARALGGQHSAQLLLASLDMQPLVRLQAAGDWQGIGMVLAHHARLLEKAGVGAFLVASNTMHIALAPVLAAVAIPVLDIFDATATALKQAGKRRLGLLGTRYTMSHAFYRGEYARRGIDVLVPNPQSAARVNDIIFHELIHNTVNPASASFYRRVVQELVDAGAEGVILGCTEIGLLLPAGSVSTSLFDTAAIHAAAAAAWLLAP